MGMSERERGLLLKLQAATQALDDVRTLDEWQAKNMGRQVRIDCIGVDRWDVEITDANGSLDWADTFDTAMQARAKAAAWVRGQK